MLVKDYRIVRWFFWLFVILVAICAGVFIYVFSEHAPSLADHSASSAEPARDIFSDLLDAIEQQESGGDANAVCDVEVCCGDCVGAYQLTKIYIDDCNRIMQLYGSRQRVTYEHRWDRDMSRWITKIVTIYYTLHDGKSTGTWPGIETAARTHRNPNKRNHPDTKEYWLKIKARMEAANG